MASKPTGQSKPTQGVETTGSPRPEAPANPEAPAEAEAPAEPGAPAGAPAKAEAPAEAEAKPEAPQSPWSRFVQSLVDRQSAERLGLAVTLLAATVYGMYRVGYDIYYSRFGLTPEEAGITYATVLSRAFRALALSFFYLFLSWIIIDLAAWFWRWIKPTDKKTKHPFPGRDVLIRQNLDLLVESRSTIIMWVFIGIVVGWAFSYIHAIRIYNGEGHTLPGIVDPYVFHAESVELIWLQDKPRTNATRHHRLVYLGKSEGVAVIYDSTVRQVIRAPVESVAIAFSREGSQRRCERGVEETDEQIEGVLSTLQREEQLLARYKSKKIDTEAAVLLTRMASNERRDSEGISPGIAPLFLRTSLQDVQEVLIEHSARVYDGVTSGLNDSSTGRKLYEETSRLRQSLAKSWQGYCDPNVPFFLDVDYYIAN